MEKYIVDRIENDFVVLEKSANDNIIIEKASLPSHINEGDVIIKDKDVYIIDIEETKKRKNELFELQNKLFLD